MFTYIIIMYDGLKTTMELDIFGEVESTTLFFKSFIIHILHTYIL